MMSCPAAFPSCLPDAWIFIAVIGGLQLAMFLLLTRVYFGMLPEGHHCPLCDGETLSVERTGWRRVIGRRYRHSWCIACGWQGLHRRTDAWMAAHRRRRRGAGTRGDVSPGRPSRTM
jgi:hypothetical protein